MPKNRPNETLTPQHSILSKQQQGSSDPQNHKSKARKESVLQVQSQTIPGGSLNQKGQESQHHNSQSTTTLFIYKEPSNIVVQSSIFC